MAVLAAGLGAVSCVGNGDDAYYPGPRTGPDGGADASKVLDATLGDAEGGESGLDADDGASDDGEASTATLALLRVANWSADSPAVDFCVAVHGTGAFQGPILGASAASMEEAGGVLAGSGALSFPQASNYLLFQPAQYDARIVAAGSVDCATGITQDATGLSAVASGGLETIALVGAGHPQDGEPGLKIVGFLDELEGSLKGALIVRVINAAVDLPKAEVGTLDTYFTPFTQPVGFGNSSVGDPMADPNGYIAELPIVSKTIAARASVATLLDASAHTIVAQAPNISLASGATVTFVVVGANGQVASDGGSGIAALLECVDNAGSVGLQGTCQVIPPPP
jgi:hypothetical protein